jgi:hypothetical protein
MNNNELEQENKPIEPKEKEDVKVNFIGWGGAILSLLSVAARTNDTIQNDVFVISLFVAGVSLSFVALQFKPRWTAFVGLAVSLVAFSINSSLIGF